MLQQDYSTLDLFQTMLPRAALVALTEEALHALPHLQLQIRHGLVGIYAFPFRIGRESRVLKEDKNGRGQRKERFKPGAQTPNNDLYLIDHGHLLNISREHLLIEQRGNSFLVVDRNSACGFSVAGLHVGGEGKGGSSPIHSGQELALGAPSSPYRFRFVDFSIYSIIDKPDALPAT